MLAWHLPDSLLSFHKPKKELINLFLSGVSRKISVVILSLFSPIYIFQTAVSFGWEKKFAIFTVILYYLIIFFVKLIALIFSENLSQKIGFKGTIRASLAPALLFIPSIIFASSHPYLFVTAAILWGIHAGFFWWGYHGYFVKTGDSESFGLSLGEAGLLETIALIITPFLGALITSLLGFNALFVFSAFFMILTLVFLGRDHDKRQRNDIKFDDVYFLIKEHKSISLAYIGSSAESTTYAVIWPLFLFLFFGDVISLGGIVSIAMLVAAFFSLTVGGWTDKQGEKKIVGVGTPLIVISWIIRFIDRSFTSFILADSLWNFGERMVILPLNALTYRKALESRGSATAILFRETTLIIGAVLLTLIMGALVIWGLDISVGFLIAAIFSTLPIIAVFKNRLRDIKKHEEKK
jgi:MFS family permease